MHAKGPIVTLSYSRGGATAAFASIVEAVHVPFTLGLVYLIAVKATPGASLVAALLQIGVIASHWGLARLKIVQQCNCYGALAESGTRSATMLTATLFVGCLLLACQCATGLASGGHVPRIADGALIFVAAAIAAVVAIVIKTRGFAAADKPSPAVGPAAAREAGKVAPMRGLDRR